MATANMPVEYQMVQRKAKVLFEYRGSVEQGDVLDVDRDAQGAWQVSLVWLSGYQSRNETVPLTSLLSVASEKGEEISIDSWLGRGFWLPAGCKWREAHASAN